jgi:hypothetical protein
MMINFVMRSATVFKGSWNKLPVALKVLKTEGGIIPSPEVSFRLIHRSILTCSSAGNET